MTWLLGLLSGLPGLLSKGLDYYIKRADGDTQRAIALMQADQARIAAQRDITIAGFSNPIFLVGWALFIFPLGFYWAKVVLWDSALGLGVTPPLHGFVLEWGGWMVSRPCLQMPMQVMS